ncbi:hypothetical protein [Winogradskya humida]|uniref:Uncharacterized protein n=1 Tax=Winogradskya humida TaxID=113566 RepID=A0ABQ3ZTR7_9ACTN|nr:hypothetical protein [Actinoplanes humidus]GIE21991.1 hypothetical protein Ahu01nite_050930 [Actinoplanes humidus]
MARGTSQSIIQRFLVDIDPAFARSQYLVFRSLFVVRPLGLGPGVREFPPGVELEGDVDSGPLVLGTSLSATVVTLGAARAQGDAGLAGALGDFGELVADPAPIPADLPFWWRVPFLAGLMLVVLLSSLSVLRSPRRTKHALGR